MLVWGGVAPQLILGCWWYAPLLTRSVNTQLALCEAWGGALDVTGRRLVAMVGRLAVGVGWQRCCFETAGNVLFFTEDRLVRRAVQWSPMKPESELVRLGWLKPDEAGEWAGPAGFHLKSLPTCSSRWLHCDFQSVPHEHADCTAGNVRANRSEASSWLRRPLCVLLRPSVTWGEIPYVLLSGPPRRHLLRSFLYNRILALPRICVVTSVIVRKGVTLVSVA
jgi:hypothetical protein